MSGTKKTLNCFAELISDEETACVNGLWFALVLGVRLSDKKEILELRTWKGGILQDVVCEHFDRRVREHQLERDFDALKKDMEAKKLEHWCEGIRHG